MKIVGIIVYSISVLLLLAGLFFRMESLAGGNMMLLLGLAGISLYFITGIVVDLVRRENNNPRLFLKVLTVLMCFVLFTKHLHMSIGDYPAWVVIPLFIVAALYYFIKGKNRQGVLTFNTVLFAGLIVPIIIG